MKRLFLLALFVCSFFPMILAQNLQLDEVLNRYYKANRFDLLQKVNTVIMKGTLLQQDAMPLAIIKKRPGKFKMIFDVQDITACQVFDGTTAWMTAPWTGNPAPQVMSPERTRDMMFRADFDGIIFDWKVKGHNAELIGTDTVAGNRAYKIKLTRKDGNIEYWFIGANDFMLMKRLTFRKVRDKEVEVETLYSDYRKINGVPFAFNTETLMGGQPYNSSQFDIVTVDEWVNDSVFMMPVID